MTTPEGLVLPHAGRTGQGTQIEQSRAAAEVYASVLAAEAHPRNVQLAIRAMSEVCRMHALAERAFFRYSRSGNQITGASIHLARELARCWGNVQYGVAELRRDDQYGQSEMQAYAVDLETNVRNASIFIVPHARHTKQDGHKALTDPRDIYENNANAGARRVREALFAVLPIWYVEQAKTLCTKTLEDGGGKPLPQRIAQCIELFNGLGVAEQQLEQKVGRPSKAWTPLDLAPLTVIYQSIQRGEATKDEEFPPETLNVTAAELAAPTELPAAGAAPATQRTAQRKTRTTKTSAPARGGAEAAPAAAAPGAAGPPPPGEQGQVEPEDVEALLRQEQLEMEAEIAEQEAAGAATRVES